MERQTTEQIPEGIEQKPERPERIVPINDFARRQNLSRRTIDRYIQLGKVESRRLKGKTFVVDSPIKSESTLKTQSPTAQTAQPEAITKIDLMTKIEWAQFGLLTARARAKRIWQIVAIVAIQLERHAGTLSKIQQEHNRLTNQLQAQNNQLTTENKTLKAQNNLLTSKIESLEAPAQNKALQPILTSETPSQ